MGSRRIASVLARAGLHLGGTTVRRMLKPKPRPAPAAIRTIAPRVVTARRPNHVWHLDLSTVPIGFGFWIPWLPLSLPQRRPFCWWIAVVVDHYPRRLMGLAVFLKETTAADVTCFLGRICHEIGSRPAHLIADHGTQFTAAAFAAWCRRRSIQQRFGAIGKYGSLAVVERFIRSLKNESTRAILVPFHRDAFRHELHGYAVWFNADRPHSLLAGATPDEIDFGTMPANRKPRFEPRDRWPRPSPCARPQALVRGRPGAELERTSTIAVGRGSSVGFAATRQFARGPYEVEGRGARRS